LQGLDYLIKFLPVEPATEEDLLRFHTAPYVERVKALSAIGEGYLDEGDTPVFPHMFEASTMVVGSVLTAAKAMMGGKINLVLCQLAAFIMDSVTGLPGFAYSMTLAL